MATRRLSNKTLQAIRRYGPSVADVAQQYGISGEALLAKLVVGESGDDPNATSGAGAHGRTQFMPGSRDIAVQKYGVDPWRSADEAVHAAALHLRGKINGSSGLEGYNPGDPNYPSYILNQKVGDVRGGGSSTPASDGGTTTTTSRVLKSPAVDRSTERRAAVMDFLGSGGVGNRNAVLELAGSYGGLADTPATYGTKTTTKKVKGSTSAPTSGPLPESGENPWGVVDSAGRSGLYLQDKYKIATIGGYRANDPYPDHPSRKALDLMVGNDRKKGSKIARELTANAEAHGVKYIIWNQRIWHPGEGWRKMEDRGSPTQNHKDHVHVLYE